MPAETGSTTRRIARACVQQPNVQQKFGNNNVRNGRPEPQWISAAAVAIRCSSRAAAPAVAAPAIVQAPAAAVLPIVQAADGGAAIVQAAAAVPPIGQVAAAAGDQRPSAGQRPAAAKAAETPSEISSPAERPARNPRAGTPAWAGVAVAVAVAAEHAQAAVAVAHAPEAGGGRGGGGWWWWRRSWWRRWATLGHHDQTRYQPSRPARQRSWLFDFLCGSNKPYVGVMAQEVAVVRPDAVARGPDGTLRVFL